MKQVRHFEDSLEEEILAFIVYIYTVSYLGANNLVISVGHQYCRINRLCIPLLLFNTKHVLSQFNEHSNHRNTNKIMNE